MIEFYTLNEHMVFYQIYKLGLLIIVCVVFNQEFPPLFRQGVFVFCA